MQTQIVPAGVHTVQWTYAKDDSVSSGLDTAWLDQVAFAPAPPLITGQPQGGTVWMGGTFVLSVNAAGTPPLAFQWTKDGTAVGSDSSTFTVSNSTRRDSGVYAVVASNAGGATTSSNAYVRVLVAQKLSGSAWFENGTLTLLSGDADGGTLSPIDLGGFELQASTNLLEWTTVPEQLGLTNGLLLLRDSQASDFRNRFYRIIER